MYQASSNQENTNLKVATLPSVVCLIWPIFNSPCTYMKINVSIDNNVALYNEGSNSFSILW